MYLHIVRVVEQNMNHRFYMRHFENTVFETCFPPLYVSLRHVKLQWSSDPLVPISMEFRYDSRPTSTGPFNSVVETYSKTLSGNEGSYAVGVDCERMLVTAGGEREKYRKTQSFISGVNAWIAHIPSTPSRRIQGGARGGRLHKNEEITPPSDPWVSHATVALPKNALSVLARRCHKMLRLKPGDVLHS